MLNDVSLHVRSVSLNPEFLRAFETVRFRWQLFRQSIHDQMTNMVERERKREKDRPVNIGKSQAAKNAVCSYIQSTYTTGDNVKWNVDE